MTKRLPSNLREAFYLDPASPSGLSKKTELENLQPVGWLERHGYWRIKFKGQKYWAHRVCYYLHTGKDPYDLEIDHIDGNTQNNQPENLRACSISLNQANQKLSQRNTSGYKGVTWKATKNKWSAQISCSGRYFYLGLYDSALDAAKAYDVAALEMFGNHAKTNGTLELF